MNNLQDLQKSAESILTICAKEQHTKKDKTHLLKLHDEIVQIIESLSECGSCNSIDAIATITLNGMTAKLCKECGINALQTGKIKKKRTRKRKTKKVKESQNGGRRDKEGNPISSVNGVGPLFEEELKSIGICTDVELIQRVESTGVHQILEEIKQNKQDARLSVKRIETIYENAKAEYSSTPE